MSTQCPFCMQTIRGGEEERLIHALDLHSTKLAMAAAILSTKSRLGVSWDSYRSWVEEQKARRGKPGA